MIVPGTPFHQGRNAYKDSDGRKYGIAIHNTSNTASDTAEASYADHRTDGVSAHFYVDADSVTQSLDTAAKAGHAGSSSGNENAIAVEITGSNDKPREWWLANVAWAQLSAVLAQVIRAHWPDGSFQVRRASVAEMQANPKVKALYGHDDMRRAWGGTTHTDPGPSFPWDRLIDAINAALGAAGGVTVYELGDRTIRQGDQGSDVYELRVALNRLGQLGDVGAGEASGTFDAGVTAAVRAFQRDHGLTVDGVVGPKTSTALAEAIAALPAPPAPVEQPPASTPVDLTALFVRLDGIEQAVASLRRHLGDVA